ncbi:NUC1 [Sanghuangporus weigelae]
MPGATIAHAAFFAVGAIVGGGTVAAVAVSRQRQPVPVPSRPGSTSAVVAPGPPPSPLVQVESKGIIDLAKTAEKLPGTVLKYGNPGPISDFLVRKAYVAVYDRRLRHPAWTAEHLTLSSLGRSILEAQAVDDDKGDRSRSVFTEDTAIPLPFRARLQDYFRSGYDRGHMVPAADAKASQDAMDETFLLTNIAPQVGVDFNRHYWAYVEEWCRRLTSTFQDVYVFTVPLYLPKKEPDGKWRVTYEVIGNPPNIGVPTHFAKVVLASRPSSPSRPDVQEISTGAFVLPNAAIPDTTSFESFSVPVDAVERAAGLTLFSDEIKKTSKYICKTTKCEVLVRRFDDAQKQIKAPKKQ